MSRLNQKVGEPLHEFERRIETGVLEQREKTHGVFDHVAAIAQTIKTELRTGDTYHDLTAAQSEALDLLATKMARIVNGDADHVDHWDDIIGYGKLGREACTDPNQGKFDV